MNAGGIRVQRRYDATRAELWGALTDSASVSRWLGRPLPAEVTALEHERSLEVEWNFPGEPVSRVRFELHDDGDGVRLVVDHRGLDRAESTAYGEGWKHHLVELDSVITKGALT